jgi:hypothetical protein
MLQTNNKMIDQIAPEIRRPIVMPKAGAEASERSLPSGDGGCSTRRCGTSGGPTLAMCRRLRRSNHGVVEASSCSSGNATPPSGVAGFERPTSTGAVSNVATAYCTFPQAVRLIILRAVRCSQVDSYHIHTLRHVKCG